MNTVKAIEEMMNVWNKTIAAAKAAYPNATEEEIYQITKSAMNKSLGM